MRMRKKPNLSPRMERCGRFLIGDPASYRGHWRDLKPDAADLRLELGCGKGRFTAETAQQHPDTLYIALERVPDAMIVAMERCMDKGLTNVFFIDQMYINFCDPWPSNRHAKRRLTHENFLVLYRGILKTGGKLCFKTDNRDLFEFSLFQFPKAGYDLSEVTRDLHNQGICGVMTDYEAKFHDQGVPINRCVGTKLAVDPEPEFHPIPGWGDAHPGVRPDSEREEADGQAPEEEQAD